MVGQGKDHHNRQGHQGQEGLRQGLYGLTLVYHFC